MITIHELKNMCLSSSSNNTYFRPFICKGDLNKTSIFLIGTNPATPITNDNLNLDEYVKLLLDYNEFINYYQNIRLNKGLSKLSRTRLGINAFIHWLNNISASCVIETNVIPYPTDDIKSLKKESSLIINRAKDIFYELLIRFTPKILIVHGNESLKLMLHLLKSKDIIINDNTYLYTSIDDIEKIVPFTSFKYPNGNVGYIVVCRHFMYYGNNGNSFFEFKSKLSKLIEI